MKCFVHPAFCLLVYDLSLISLLAFSGILYDNTKISDLRYLLPTETLINYTSLLFMSQIPVPVGVFVL